MEKNRIVLGLDVSISCIGVSIVMDDGTEIPKIVKMTHLIPKVSNEVSGIEALILRKEIFEENFLDLIKGVGITDCVIETPQFTNKKERIENIIQVAQFNGLISEAIYRKLNIIPAFISSHDSRMYSFPELVSLRKFNKKGELYPLNHYIHSLKDNHVIPFGDFPFDCDKKNIVMDIISERYPDIEWVYNSNGSLKKENYDACDSLVCTIAYINKNRYGKLDCSVDDWEVINDEDGKPMLIRYTTNIYGKTFKKELLLRS